MMFHQKIINFSLINSSGQQIILLNENKLNYSCTIFNVKCGESFILQAQICDDNDSHIKTFKSNISIEEKSIKALKEDNYGFNSYVYNVNELNLNELSDGVYKMKLFLVDPNGNVLDNCCSYFILKS